MPCPFVGSCSESRQRLQAGYNKTEGGRWVLMRAPLEGTMCWAYQQLMTRPEAPVPMTSDTDLERQAIQQETKS